MRVSKFSFPHLFTGAGSNGVPARQSRGGGKPLALAFVFAAFVASPAFAGWQDEATPRDIQRMAAIDRSRAQGLSDLDSGPVKGDASTMRDVAGAAGGDISADELLGDWRCRTIRLGGVFSIEYSWFRCSVSERGGHLYFEKLSGSQLINGWLYPDDGRFVLLGGWSVVGEPRHAYSGRAAGYGASATPDDAIGLVSSLGTGHAKIEFPAPVQESDFDVMELER